jgi:hypothetical protein
LGGRRGQRKLFLGFREGGEDGWGRGSSWNRKAGNVDMQIERIFQANR